MGGGHPVLSLKARGACAVVSRGRAIRQDAVAALGCSCTPGDMLAFRKDSILCLPLWGCMAVPRLGGAHVSGPCILLMEAGVETRAGAGRGVSGGNTPPVTAVQTPALAL